MRVKHKLTPAFVERRSKVPGSYGDGGGLYLYVSGKAAASWVYCFMLAGVSREMGLGPYPDISLDTARDLADEARRLKARGQDPIDVRKALRDAQRLADAKAITFRECVERYIEYRKALPADKKDAWRNPKSAKLWTATLETYAQPKLGKLCVGAIDQSLVVEVLEPIWNTKPETAGRVRGRIEAVLDWAGARDYRAGENPARWGGWLKKRLPERRASAVRHHPALSYAELPQFMARLQVEEGLGATVLRFVILTGARTGEAIGATWAEMDLNRGVWTIPAERMKMKRPHRVPLSKPVLAILQAQHNATGGKGYVFPGTRSKKPLSNMAMLKTLERMDRQDITPHGFRATFKTWATECSAFPREAIELSLAHRVGDAVEQAYQRGELLIKRAQLMSAWAEFCTKVVPANFANVFPMKGKTAP